MNALVPFPFHTELRDHFKKRERTWKWFGEQKVKDEQAQAHRRLAGRRRGGVGQAYLQHQVHRAQLDLAPRLAARLDATVLRPPALGDVHAAEDLDARSDCDHYQGRQFEHLV